MIGVTSVDDKYNDLSIRLHGVYLTLFLPSFGTVETRGVTIGAQQSIASDLHSGARFCSYLCSMNVVRIVSIADEALMPYSRLTERQLQSRLHPEEGLFICESLKVIRVALEHGLKPVSFLCEEKFLPQVEELFSNFNSQFSFSQVPVYTAPREVLKSLTGYELSRGVLCAMQRPKQPSVDELFSNYNFHFSTSRVAVLDGVVNSENTGAIFRAAAALGIDAVLLTRTCCDPLNRRACRVSMGTVFQLPWTLIDGVKSEESRVKNYPLILRDFGFTTVAMALTDRSVPVDDPSLRGIDRMAIVLGTEGDGLSDSVLQRCDHVARIPMQRGVDSLNVAAAAAVAFYELCQ